MTSFQATLKIDTPARYRIRVQGTLDESLSNRLGGLCIWPSGTDVETSVTTLEGQVVDQSALSGILNFLIDLGFPLLSVECLEIKQAA